VTAPSISKLVLELFKTVYARTSPRASATKSLRRVLFSDIYQANTVLFSFLGRIRTIRRKWDVSGTSMNYRLGAGRRTSIGSGIRTRWRTARAGSSRGS
jgi:hypothetical protein